MSGGLKDLVAKLRLDTTGFSNGLRGVQTTLRNFGAGMTAASTGLALAIKGQLDIADDLSKMSQKFGISIEDLSRLGYAADLSGVSTDSLGASLKKLSRNMSDAASGQKAQVELFKRLGISVTDSEGRMRSTEAVLRDIADVMAKLPDGADKTALALDVFGKSGAEMIPMLNGGSSALAELTAEAQAMGIVIDGPTGKAAEDFNDNISKLQTSIRGLAVQMSATLAPTLKGLTEDMVEFTKSFQSLSPETKELGTKIAVIGMVLGPVLLGVAWGISTIGSAIATIGAVATSLWGIATAAAAAGAAVVAALGWPVTLTVIAIGGAVAAIIAYWDEVKAGTLAAGTYITLAVTSWPAGIRAAWKTITDEIATWPQAFIDTGRYIVEGLKQGIQEQWDAMVKWLSDKAEALKSIIPDKFWVRSPSRFMREVGNNITEGLRLGLQDGTPAAAAAMTGIADAVKGAAGGLNGGLFDGVEGAARSAFKGVLLEGMGVADALRQSFANLLSNKANSLLDSAFSSIWSGITGLFGFANGGAFANGRVTAFASGGVVTGTTVFPMARGLGMMGEAGPEAIMPLTRMSNGKLGVASGGGAQSMSVSIGFDDTAGGFTAFVRDQAGRVVAQAAPKIVRQSVASTGKAMRATKAFGGA